MAQYGQPTIETLQRQLAQEQSELERYTEDAATYAALADKLLQLRDRATADIEDARDLAALAQLEVVLVEAELEERRNRRWADTARAEATSTALDLARTRELEEREQRRTTDARATHEMVGTDDEGGRE
jgi:translation initiation factor 2B subunit (eIF-2B alpha/beta/delta family)